MKHKTMASLPSPHISDINWIFVEMLKFSWKLNFVAVQPPLCGLVYMPVVFEKQYHSSCILWIPIAPYKHFQDLHRPILERVFVKNTGRK